MWFDENDEDATSAFQSNGQPRGDFLIFRLPIDSVIIFEGRRVAHGAANTRPRK